MKFILDEREYEVLQSYKKKYDELVKQDSTKKEEYLQEYFDLQKKEGDRLVKIVVETSPTQQGYTYYVWTEVNTDMLTEALKRSPNSEIL